MQECVKNRIYYIDALKGFAILLVVLGHAIHGSTSDPIHNLFFRLIYSFHMPLFIFISGYLTHFYKDSNFFSFVIKKFKLLIIPFLNWWLIYCLSIKLIDWHLNFKCFFCNIVNSPVPGLWFFVVLFLCSLTLAISVKLSKKLKFFAFLLVFIIIRLIHFKYLWFSHFQWYYLFFLIGYFISKYDIFNKKFSFLFLLGIIFYPFLFQGWSPTNPDCYIYLHCYLLPFCAILPIFKIFQQLDKFLLNTKFYKHFCWLGLYTFDIYAIHQTLLIGLVNVGQGATKIIISTIAYILGSLLISFFIIRKSKILTLLLLGNHNTTEKSLEK